MPDLVWQLGFLLLGVLIGVLIGVLVKEAEWQSQRQQFEEWARGDAVDRSRYILKGQIAQQIAPLLPEFTKHFDPADARFLGSPVDYIVFKGLSKIPKTKGGSEVADPMLEVWLVDIKTGNSRLSRPQQLVEQAVKQRRVHFMTLRLPLSREVPVPDREGRYARTDSERGTPSPVSGRKVG